VSKWALWTLTAAFIVFVFAAMSSTALLKQPFNPDEDVLAQIDALDQATSGKDLDWNQAESARKGLKSAWERVRVRVQFVAEKDDIVRFGRTIDELKGAISAEDLSMTKRSIETLRSIWHSMR